MGFVVTDMNAENNLVLYTSSDGTVSLPVAIDHDTVWLTRLQLSELFDRDVKTIGKHIQNALREELDTSVVAKFATTAADGKTYLTEHYAVFGFTARSRRFL